MSIATNNSVRAAARPDRSRTWGRGGTSRRPNCLRVEMLENRIAPSGLLDVLLPSLELAGRDSGISLSAASDLFGPTALVSAMGKGGKPSAKTSSNSVSGEAFGVSVNLTTVLGAQVTMAKTPHVVLPPNGGMESDDVLTVDVPGALHSETLTVITTGAIGQNVATAQSSATVENVNILNGLVTADLVVAFSSSFSDGKVAMSNADGSTLINLTVNGVFMGDVTPAANTSIAIPGVGTVILNEQIGGGNGRNTTFLTVNMIHVDLDGTVGSGDIIVSSAHSDVNFKPAPVAGPQFMTGGGRLGTGRDIATFGLNAGIRDGAPQGQLQYIDHAAGLNVHSTSIDSFSVIEGTTCVTFSGQARVNGQTGFTFTVTEACDNGEPGIGHDTLAISVSGPNLNYSNSGVLTGGNLQLHPTQ